ncbi:glycosyl hydrolase [Ruminococcus albus]|uniref:Mannan endo-1,4-beta-mannosidase n=1 Tax=Ruminococcus albus TaxID=1264 RepID=A0A1I1ID25_RUMAL|nr:glycosyl hydrolase [Ruminococcus albus]SFC34156.1 mannan endo-1,4-beta-mannosidase [Ruminococcus albus]
MKNIKRILALTLALTMSAGLIGCGKSTNEEKGKKESDSAESRSADDSTAEEKPAVNETTGDFDLSDFTSAYDVSEDFSLELEAEKGTLLNEAMLMDKAFAGEFSGDGYVAVYDKGDEVTFDIELPSKGSYNVILRLATDNVNSENLITLDGNAVKKFASSDPKFTDVTAENVLLEGGTHTIGVRAETGRIYVDTLKIVPAAPVDIAQYEVTDTLCNPNASDNAKRLYSFLRAVYGKYTISGQYSGDNLGYESREFIEINKRTGKTPAILGLDVMNLGISTKIDHQAGGGDMIPIQVMDWYNNHNGIVTLCWHWHAPAQYLEVNGQPWWRGFYTDSTNFDLGKAMSGDDKEGYDAIVAELDNMAEQLKPLAEADIPILWRPLHEAAGDPKYPNNAWFWWGASGKDPYLELYKLMYDKFVNEYHLDNLIWVWNAQNQSWYPGDEYVDIVGYDCYPAEQDSSSQKYYYDFLKECSPTGSKIIAETENGSMFDPDAAFNEGTRWAYFGTWNGEFAIKNKQLSDQYTTFDMWDKIYSSDRVLTLEELPDLKSWPIDLEAYLAAK